MLNKKKILSFIIVLSGMLFFSLYAYGTSNRLVLVYPKNGATIKANSTFFIGHTDPSATMTINGEPVKVYSNGSFVRVYKLKSGINKIVLKSDLNGDERVKKLVLNVPDKKSSSKINPPVMTEKEEIILITEKEAPLRKSPYGERLTPVKEKMLAESVGIINNHYKVRYQNGYAYILKNFAKSSEEKLEPVQKTGEILFDEDYKNIYLKIRLEKPVLAFISADKNSITVKLEKTLFDFPQQDIQDKNIQKFEADENSFTLSVNADVLNGYDYYYEDDKFVLKVRKPFTKYIEGKVVVIDPGHGGKEMGSIGPTEVPEKDINLNISRYLKEELLKAGAHVYMTRNDDSYVDLYERVEFAQKKNADILVSIHNNALPDGQNPYIKHGTETYYFQPQAKKLANSVQKNLVMVNGFKDLGVKYGSLVLARPSSPVSILVEVGFMINPFEYEALLIPENQKKYAEGIKNGIVEYFKQ